MKLSMTFTLSLFLYMSASAYNLSLDATNPEPRTLEEAVALCQASPESMSNMISCQAAAEERFKKKPACASTFVVDGVTYCNSLSGLPVEPPPAEKCSLIGSQADSAFCRKPQPPPEVSGLPVEPCSMIGSQEDSAFCKKAVAKKKKKPRLPASENSLGTFTGSTGVSQ